MKCMRFVNLIKTNNTDQNCYNNNKHYYEDHY